MGKAIVVTSGKGGVGKTTLAANLGAALAMRGERTLLIDADMGLRNLDMAIGMDSSIVYDLFDAATGGCDLKKAVLCHGSIDNLYLLPASQTKDKSALTRAQMRNLIRLCRPEYDFILIDCPPGIDRGFEAATSGADEAIVVTIPEPCAIRDADRVIGLLEKQELTDMKLVINRMKSALIKKGLMPGVEEILSDLSVDLLGVAPEDEEIHSPCAVVAAQNPKSEAGRAFCLMAARLCGENAELMNFKGKKGFLKRLFE